MLPAKANSVFLGIVACVLSWLSSASALSITIDKDKIDYWNGWIILTALILIAVGFVVTLAGYRLFKLLVIVAGFLFGSGVTYYALYLTVEWPLWGIILTAILAGLIVAVLFHCLYLFAVFMLGFTLGFVSMYYICVAFLDPVLTGELSGNWQFYITAAIVLVAGALVGIVTLLLERHLLIFFSSIGGAFLLVLGIDYFTGDCQLCSYLAVWEGNEPSLDDITITTWVMLGLWGLSALVGLIVQYGLTARNYSAKKKNNKKDKKGKDKVEVSAVQMEHPSEQHTSLVYVEVDTGSHSHKSYGAIPYLPPPPLNPELHHVNATSPPSTSVFNPNVKVF